MIGKRKSIARRAHVVDSDYEPSDSSNEDHDVDFVETNLNPNENNVERVEKNT